MTSRAVRETYVSNLVSFRVKTTKLLRFYGSRQKDEIAGNANRESDGTGQWRPLHSAELIRAINGHENRGHQLSLQN